MHSKRGDGAVGWGQIALIIYIIWMAVVTIILVYNMQALKQAETDIPQEAFDLVHRSRIFLGSDCLVYEEGGRALAWTMDWNRFKDSTRLNACLPFPEGGPALNVTLIRGSERRSVWHTNYQPNIGKYGFAYPVLIREQQALTSGTLLVEASR